METAFTVSLIALLGYTAFLSFGLPKETITGDVLGASGFPLILVALGLVLCVLQLIRALRTRHTKEEKLVDLSTPAGRVMVYTLVALIVYIALLNILGFILSTFIFAVIGVMVMGYRKKRNILAFALITTTALFLLFGKAFFVPLPRGIGFLRELSYLLY